MASSHIILPPDDDEEEQRRLEEEEDEDPWARSEPPPAAPEHAVKAALPFSATCVRISRDSYPNLRALRNASSVSLADAAYVKISEGDFGYVLDDVPHLVDHLPDAPVSGPLPTLPSRCFDSQAAAAVMLRSFRFVMAFALLNCATVWSAALAKYTRIAKWSGWGSLIGGCHSRCLRDFFLSDFLVWKSILDTVLILDCRIWAWTCSEPISLLGAKGGMIEQSNYVVKISLQCYWRFMLCSNRISCCFGLFGLCFWDRKFDWVDWRISPLEELSLLAGCSSLPKHELVIANSLCWIELLLERWNHGPCELSWWFAILFICADLSQSTTRSSSLFNCQVRLWSSTFFLLLISELVICAMCNPETFVLIVIRQYFVNEDDTVPQKVKQC